MAIAGAVNVFKQNFKGQMGYDLLVTDENATVQDYLDAINQAIEEYPLTRGRNKVLSCRGCEFCCAERAPITFIDLLKIKKHLNINEKSLQKTLDRVGYIVVNGPAVDITLRRGDDDRCIFLQRKEGTCSIYAVRPLVCQTFICCPASTRAARLRELIINLGEDELVRQWLLQTLGKGIEPGFHEGYKPKIKLNDWEPNAFTDRKNYTELKLKEICTPVLWKKLTQPSG